MSTNRPVRAPRTHLCEDCRCPITGGDGCVAFRHEPDRPYWNVAVVHHPSACPRWRHKQQLPWRIAQRELEPLAAYRGAAGLTRVLELMARDGMPLAKGAALLQTLFITDFAVVAENLGEAEDAGVIPEGTPRDVVPYEVARAVRRWLASERRAREAEAEAGD